MGGPSANGDGSQSAEDLLVAPPAPGALIRPTVRVLLIDEAERVLLLRAAARADGPQVWFAVGGGIESDESPRVAALREIREETGLTQLTLGPEIWRRRDVLDVDTVTWDLRERWYLARVAGFVPTRAGFTPWEATRISDVRWWSADELVHTSERVAPAALGGLLAKLVADGPPDEPVVIST